MTIKLKYKGGGNWTVCDGDTSFCIKPNTVVEVDADKAKYLLKDFSEDWEVMEEENDGN